MPTKTRHRGSEMEDLALNYLRSKGFLILERNFTIRGGEIDLILSKDNFIVFVEVKSTPIKSEFSVFSSLSKNKKLTLKKTINEWLLRRDFIEKEWRFDFVGIQRDNGLFKIDHFEFVSLD